MKKTGASTYNNEKYFPEKTNPENVLNYLLRKYPNKFLSLEAYKSERFSIKFSQTLTSATGMSVDEWLKHNGFVVDIVTADMRTGVTGRHGFGSAEELADYVFDNYPLAGEYIMTAEEEILLFSRAKEIFNKAAESVHLNGREKSVLVLETIYMLQNFGLQDEDNDDSMWNYIFRQFGLAEKEPRRKLYSIFRQAIDYVMKHYNRYFAPKSTMRYYTTLMLHSMMPVSSIEHFFNILMQFYCDNLDYQYIPNDPIYRILANTLSEKWNSKQYSGSELHVRSDTVASGLKILFAERHGYAAQLSDTLVRKLDAFLKGEETDVVSSDSRWDRLMVEWLDKRSPEKKNEQRQNMRCHISQRTETNIKQTKGTYILRENDIQIFFPNIRLEKILEEKPVLIVSVDGDEILREQLGFYGDVCTTIRGFSRTLSDILKPNTESLNINFKIMCGDEELYDSAESLYRRFVLFDMKRAVECQLSALNNCQNIGIFAPDSLDIEINEEKYDAHSVCGGTLYDIINDNETFIFVDKKRIYTSQSRKNSFILRSSEEPADGARAIINGKEYVIYTRASEFTITVPEAETKLHKYQVCHGKDRYSLSILLGEDDESFTMESSEEYVPNSIRIIDQTTGRMVFELNYIVVRKFEFIFSQPIYKYPCNNVSVEIEYKGDRTNYYLTVSEQNTAAAMMVDGTEIELSVPIIRCNMMGKNAFSSVDALWHKDIAINVFMDIDCPAQWKCSVFIDRHKIPEVSPGKYEIGNFIVGYSTENTKEKLTLMLENGGSAIKYNLSEIAFHEHFIAEPATCENRSIVWNADGLFVGGQERNFIIKIFDEGKIIRERSVGIDTERFDDILPNKVGIYNYEVYLPRKSVFSKKESKIHTGELVVGDINSFKFKGKTIVATSASYYDTGVELMKSMQLHSEGFIFELKYLGKSDPYNSGMQYPEYEAVLSYFNAEKKQYVKYSYVDNEEYEKINPVKVWIINDHILEIRNPYGEGLYIDKKHRRILLKRPEKVFNYNERDNSAPQMNMVDIADSFEYRVI